jgi:hypothetical protein
LVVSAAENIFLSILNERDVLATPFDTAVFDGIVYDAASRYFRVADSPFDVQECLRSLKRWLSRRASSDLSFAYSGGVLCIITGQGIGMTKLASTPVSVAGMPKPGSVEELRRFAQIQERLKPLAERLVADPRIPQTVVVVPSLTLDLEELAKIPGVHYYEERLLCMLMLLRMPRTHLVFVTSQQVPNAIVDYYLHLLPGVPLRHARIRLTLLSCHDSSDVPLT